MLESLYKTFLSIFPNELDSELDRKFKERATRNKHTRPGDRFYIKSHDRDILQNKREEHLESLDDEEEY